MCFFFIKILFDSVIWLFFENEGVVCVKINFKDYSIII